MRGCVGRLIIQRFVETEWPLYVCDFLRITPTPDGMPCYRSAGLGCVCFVVINPVLPTELIWTFLFITFPILLPSIQLTTVAEKDTVVYVDGAFDLFHYAHAKALESAKVSRGCCDGFILVPLKKAADKIPFNTTTMHKAYTKQTKNNEALGRN